MSQIFVACQTGDAKTKSRGAVACRTATGHAVVSDAIGPHAWWDPIRSQDVIITVIGEGKLEVVMSHIQLQRAWQIGDDLLSISLVYPV